MDIFKNGVQRKGLWIERKYNSKGNIIKSIYKDIDGKAKIIYHYKRRNSK